ncbi:MAG TPA: response regulator [Pirellulaceae bacterium]|nr:response regulator [Pirellulaceae bacterium]
MDRDPIVFVVDDDQAARESVVALVESKGLRVQGFASAEEFLDQYDPSEVGCLVVDVRMNGMTGLQLIEQLATQGSKLPVVVITGYGDIPMAVRAMQMGAVTFLQKPCQVDELWEGIRKALEQEYVRQVGSSQRSEVQARSANLSSEELAVFHKILEGLPNKRIATDLDIGLRTVEMRRANIMRKMQADSLPQLVRMAIVGGFLKPELPT